MKSTEAETTVQRNGVSPVKQASIIAIQVMVGESHRSLEGVKKNATGI
ncbi:hypothetical protein [Rossellomorea marisflavi]